MTKHLIKILECAPYGFPIGWVAARVSEGNYRLAAIDALAFVAMVGGLYIWDAKRVAGQGVRDTP